MKGNYSIRSARPHKSSGYNRFWDAPTWGLSSASRQIASLAREGRVKQDQILDIIGRHARLSVRLSYRGFNLTSVEQGMSARDIAKTFRRALYRDKAVGQSQGDYGLDVAQVHYDLQYTAEKDLDSVGRSIGVKPSLMHRALIDNHLAFIVPCLISTALVTLLAYKYGFIAGELGIENEGWKKAVNTIGGLALGWMPGLIPGFIMEYDFFQGKKEAISTGIWYTLQTFALVEAKSLTEDSYVASKAKAVLGMLGKETRLVYLSSLDADKIKLLSPVKLGQGQHEVLEPITVAALIAAHDTSVEERDNLVRVVIEDPRFRERVLSVLEMPGVSVETLFRFAAELTDKLAEKSMDMLIAREATSQVDLEVLKQSPSRRISVLAHFSDPESEVLPLAHMLHNMLPRKTAVNVSRVRVGSHWVDDPDAYEASHGYCIPTGGYMEDEYEERSSSYRYYNSTALDLAREALRLRSQSEQREIIDEVRKLDTRLANRLANPDSSYFL